MSEDIAEVFKKISSLEEEHIQSFTQTLEHEISIWNSCLTLYQTAIFETNDPLDTQLAIFYSDSLNFFLSSTHSLLRAHVMHAYSHTRAALEALAYANKILRKDSLNRLTIFQEKDPSDEEFRNVFNNAAIFKGLEEFRGIYDTLCHGVHPSIRSQSVRIKINEGNASSGYFDDYDSAESNVYNYRYAAALIAGTHLSIQAQYAKLLKSQIKNYEDWSGQLEIVSKKFDDYFREEFPNITNELLP